VNKPPDDASLPVLALADAAGGCGDGLWVWLCPPNHFEKPVRAWLF